MKVRWGVFLLDIPISAAISGGISLIGYSAIQSMSVGVAIGAAFSGLIFLLFPLLLALLYGGPVFMIANGLLKGRPGRIVGPLLMIGGVAVYSHATVALERAAAVAADTRSAGIEGSLPKTIALEQQIISCLSDCIQILATSDHEVVLRPSSNHSWERFRKITGAACEDDEHRNRYIAFLRLGFHGTCAEQIEHEAEVEDAILIGNRSHSRGDWARSGHFKGDITYVGRISNGTTTILGRWVVGRIEVPFREFLVPLGLAPRDTKVGSPIKKEDVYRAVGLTVLESNRPGSAPIPDLLAELERLGDSKHSGIGVSDQFKALLQDANDPIFVADHLTTMLNSPDVEARKLALLGLEVLQSKDIEFAKPALAKGLHGDNRDEVYRSAAIVERIPSKERGFAINGLIAAALRYIGDIDDHYMRDLLARLLKEAARDIPEFSARLETWIPADDRERRHLAKIKTILAR